MAPIIENEPLRNERQTAYHPQNYDKKRFVISQMAYEGSRI